MDMKILVTNDDGINSSAILPLAKWAAKLGKVTVVAPKYEQSGKGHAINMITPFEIRRCDYSDGINAYSVDSTPADCVRFAFLGLKTQFDFVISGINRGLNIGEDIAYSGTVGAIYEAAYLGAKAVAVSTEPTSFDGAINSLDSVGAYIKENRLFDFCGLLNVNIPRSPGKILITRQGGACYRNEFIKSEGDIYRQKSCPVYKNTGNPELDIDAVMSGYISVTPLNAGCTDECSYEILRRLNR